MLKFLDNLFSTGELVLSESESPFDERRAANAVSQLERLWRLELPGVPPAFLPGLAIMATQILMAACRAVVHRNLSAEQTKNSIRQIRLTLGHSASEHYSVDLVLRFLPQVSERARRISESDELLEVLSFIGRRWPLSSVGMLDCAPEQLPAALQHPALWRMYIDRIISTKDVSRVNISSVHDAVVAAIGPFSNLAPELIDRIKRFQL